MIDRTPLASCGRGITRHPLLTCKDIERIDHLNLLEVSAIVTMPEDEGKRRSKKERSSRPCLPDNFDALLDCRDLTVDLMIERVFRALHAWGSQFPWCQHEVPQVAELFKAHMTVPTNLLDIHDG